MKISFVFVILLFVIHSSYSQDLILKQTGEYINCKINKIDNGYIYYSIFFEKQTKDYSIFTNDVIRYEFNYYNKDNYLESGVDSIHNGKDTIVNKENNLMLTKNLSMSISCGAGFIYLTNKMKNRMPYDLDNHYKKLGMGIGYCADIAFFSKYIGIGIKYSSMNSFSKTNIEGVGLYENHINMSYYGMLFGFMYKLKKSYFITNFCVGKVKYSNLMSYPSNVLTNRSIEEGEAFGLSFDLGYEYKILKYFNIFSKISYSTGIIRQIDINDKTYSLPKDNYINLNNLSLLFGVKLMVG